MDAPFVILLSGPIEATPRLRAAVADARCIAADGGMRHAAPLGLRPELWVGDFDSVDPGLLSAYPNVPRERFSRNKDRTDGEIAIAAARERGARRLVVVGALGGARLDHAFTHLVLALRLQGEGIAVVLDDGAQFALPLEPGVETCFEAEPGAPFSILRFGAAEKLTIRGARWPLDAVDLPFESILTQSNEAAAREVRVRLERGRAVLVARERAEP